MNCKLEKLFLNHSSIIVLDTETTGLDFQNNQIIELAAIRIINDNGKIKVTKEMDHLIKLPQGEKIPKKIVELTHITDKMLLENGVEKDFACRDFVRLFTDDSPLIIAYNAQFDMNFLFYFLLEFNCHSILKKVKMLDPLTIYKDRHNYPHRLENAIITYNLQDKVTNSHRALDDVYSALEVCYSMEEEEDDLEKYINLFGYNSKYGVSGKKIRSVTYAPQGFDHKKKLYAGL